MYYPLSQITPNLYTNGGELVIESTLENYIGYYYETSTGEKYVGPIPQGNDSILLIPPPSKATEEETYSSKYVREFSFPGDADPEISVDHSLINNLTQIKYSYVSSQGTPKVRKLPTPIKSSYTQEELYQGEYKRYFAKKSNEVLYLEISLDDYKKLKNRDPKIAYDLYTCVELWWLILDTSNPDYLNLNKIQDKYQPESTDVINMRTLKVIEEENNWFGFAGYVSQFRPPILLNKPSSSPSTSTSGGGY